MEKNINLTRHLDLFKAPASNSGCLDQILKDYSLFLEDEITLNTFKYSLVQTAVLTDTKVDKSSYIEKEIFPVGNGLGSCSYTQIQNIALNKDPANILKDHAHSVVNMIEHFGSQISKETDLI